MTPNTVQVLQNTTELEFILSELTYELLDTLNLPTKWINQLKLLPQQTTLDYLLIKIHPTQVIPGAPFTVQGTISYSF